MITLGLQIVWAFPFALTRVLSEKNIANKSWLISLIAVGLLLLCISSLLMNVTGKPWRQIIIPMVLGGSLVVVSRFPMFWFWTTFTFTVSLILLFFAITSTNVWAGDRMEIGLRNQWAKSNGIQTRFELKRTWHYFFSGIFEVEQGAENGDIVEWH